MITYVIIAAVYLLGVIVALAVIAWINADDEDSIMNEGLAVFSWFTLAFIILVIVSYFVTRPFNWLYEKMKEYFER